MAEYPFPEKRFIAAKATKDELTILRREYNASDLTVQRSLSEFWNSIPASGMRDYLELQRSNGRFNALAIDAVVVKPKLVIPEVPEVETQPANSVETVADELGNNELNSIGSTEDDPALATE